jgi:DNA repair photolyase
MPSRLSPRDSLSPRSAADLARPRHQGALLGSARGEQRMWFEGEAPPVPPRKGRGAIGNPSGRFEPHARERTDDGWGVLEDIEALRTTVTPERAKTIITRNDSPDISFDRSINPYRGCEHGCVYCFARPTHAYKGLSPGLDFESRLFVKEGAAEQLERELAAPNYQPRTIAIGTNTDPYQPIERERRVMRAILEVLARTNHPVGIVTKSALIARDLDLLGPMAEKGLVKVGISITTLEADLARKLEPRAASPEKRFETIAALSAAGVPTGVMVAPVIPALTDHEIEKILARARTYGASEAGYILLRLPLETRDLFRDWLEAHVPDRAARVMAMVRGTRDGKAYDSRWGTRMTGEGPYAWMIGRRFEAAATRLGLTSRTRLRADLFVPPARPARGASRDQLSLF